MTESLIQRIQKIDQILSMPYSESTKASLKKERQELVDELKRERHIKK
jgi:hypothetical protein